MKNPFSNNEESSLERGIPVNKPTKAITSQAQAQAKAFRDDFLNQLYGKSDSTGDDKADPAAQAKQQQQAATPPPKPVRKLGGMSDSGDHAKYAMMQDLLDKGDKKGADDAMHHMQYYYDTNVGTLEEQIKKARQKRQQEEQEREKQQQEEEEQKKQAEAKEKEELPQATGKGRNRMGQPPQKKRKTNMAVDMNKNKAEQFRGSSG